MVIDDEDLITMGAEERTNIENYVRGDEVHLSGFIDVSNSKKVWSNPRGQYEYRLYPKGVPGWGGHFTDTFIELVDEYHQEHLTEEDRLNLFYGLGFQSSNPSITLCSSVRSLYLT